MTPDTPDPSAALAALRARYRAGSGRIVEAFRVLATRLADNPTAPEILDTLRRELHRVRGTAGSYGFHGVSELARTFEPQAKAWAERPTEAPERRSALVAHLADAIAAQFADDPDAAMSRLGRQLVLIDLPASVAAAVQAAAPARGYAPELRTAPAWAEDPQRGAAHVVVCSEAALSAVRGPAAAAHVPVVVVVDGAGTAPAVRTDGVDALRMVRADDGVEDIFAFADQAALQSASAGATLLVVDDDPAILELVRRIVEPDGLQVVTLNAPGRLLETLEAVQPTLLLCDVHMQDYNGTALVRGLRADPRWADLPILLFSTEADAERRADAYAAMADDFLAKPVVPAELTRRLRARVEAVRLRRLAEGRHPGTGLWLPSQFAERLDGLLAGAGAGRQVSLALVRPGSTDLDGAAARAWFGEAVRLARAMGHADTVSGFVDDTTLCVARLGPATALAQGLEALGAGAGTAWRAGVADGTADTPPGALRAGAETALAAAAAAGTLVHRHEPDDETRAPDVIVVEDDQALSDMLQFALRAAGYSYRAFTSGVEALAAMLRLERGVGRVLVLLDVDLPGLDGHTLHERLRLERPGRFAVVFCSVHAAEAEQLRALDAGAIDWLTKPISLRVLMAKVKRWRELAAAG